MRRISRLLSSIVLILGLLLIFSIQGISMHAAPVEADSYSSYGSDRYTVLLLDTAGKEIFKIYNFGPILRVGGPAEYITDSSIDEVKKSAAKFISDAKYSLNKNYIAIVTYDQEATVVSDFTDDYDKLEVVLESITSIDENDATDGTDNVTAGLECCNKLLSEISDDHAIKNVLLCTTGLVDGGKHNYEGQYSEDTIGSRWQNEDTEIRLYAYANSAIEEANKLKNSNTTIYVVGIFQPIESSLPSDGKDVAEFFRLTAHDLASADETFFVVEDPEKLDYIFGELQDDVTGTAKIRIYNDSDGYNADAPVEYPDKDDTITLGGHYEDMNWGPSLFETPATRMHLQSIVSEESPNYNLAMVCGNLCITSYNSAYLTQAYRILGFKEESVYLYSYPSSELNRSGAKRNGESFADDKDLAFSIASREIDVSGEKCDLVVITLRGTQEKWEAIKDGTCKDDKDFYGYKAWDWIYEFEEDVFAGLEDYYQDHTDLGSRKTKFLVTGHSLGGAGANLVAAKLNLEVDSDNWYSKNTTVDDIYTYTFGAIDSISKSATNSDYFKTPIEFPVVDGFDNILNIYNYLDTFGPGGNGVFGVTAAGNTMFGKFGMFYTYIKDMRGIVNPDSMWPTHEIAGYIHAVKSGRLISDKETGKIKVWIRCPVDVEIYEGDKLLCSVVDNTVKTESEQIPVSVEDDAKAFIISKNINYRILISATDSGKMYYSIQDLDNTNPALLDYQNISLEKNKLIQCELDNAKSIEDVELYVIDSYGNKIAKILADGSETKIEVKETNTNPEPTLNNPLKPKDADKGSGTIFLIIIIIIGIVLIILLIAIAFIIARKAKNDRVRETQNKN